MRQEGESGIHKPHIAKKHRIGGACYKRTNRGPVSLYMHESWLGRTGTISDTRQGCPAVPSALISDPLSLQRVDYPNVIAPFYQRTFK